MIITLCFSLQLYLGAVGSECSTVTMREAMPIVASCAAHAGDACEVITATDHTVYIIERKVGRK